MTEIDGVARRMLLCPPDLNADQSKTLIEDAGIDAIVTDQPAALVGYRHLSGGGGTRAP